MARTLGDYERHLVSARDLTSHTVRAYTGDIASMLAHAAKLGHQDVAGLDLRTLRSWLAKQQSMGKARTTIARRATAIRGVTAWLARNAGTATDAGKRTARPKANKTTPEVQGTRPEEGWGGRGDVRRARTRGVEERKNKKQ